MAIAFITFFFLFEVTYELKHLCNRLDSFLRSFVHFLLFASLFFFSLNDDIMIPVLNFTSVQILLSVSLIFYF